jgi:hypothetical protein
MRKIQKVAVVAAIVGSAGFLGSGTAFATGGPEVGVQQGNQCSTHDTSINILSNVSLLNGGILSGLLGNEGDQGETNQNIGSQLECGNAVGF